MDFCERDKKSEMPKAEKAVEESGIVWPKDSKGERSTTAAGKEIWARFVESLSFLGSHYI